MLLLINFLLQVRVFVIYSILLILLNLQLPFHNRLNVGNQCASYKSVSCDFVFGTIDHWVHVKICKR